MAGDCGATQRALDCTAKVKDPKNTGGRVAAGRGEKRVHCCANTAKLRKMSHEERVRFYRHDGREKPRVLGGCSQAP